MTKTITPGRLAFRVEGDMWNAYFARLDTMEGAIFMGSIPLGFVSENEDRKQAFMELMKGCFDDAVEGKLGVRPTWSDPAQAPEHERSGHA